jgi:hypothetical protein
MFGLRMHTFTTLEQTRSPLPIRVLNRSAAWLAKTGMAGAPLRPTDLIDAAKRNYQLDDFGEGDFFEPLSRLLESCQREARLNLVGRISLRAHLLQILCNRLLIQQDRRSYPEIARQKIQQPLFILGLPRSGTTLLHTLLATDPDHRAPLSWEVMEPSPPSRENERQRIRRTVRSLSWLNRLAPTFRCVHGVGAELPQECVSLMAPSFMSDQFDTMYYVPSYRAWFFRQDLQPAYECHRNFLQHLQYRRGAHRWILKAPTHMFALPTLLSVYPDALFVQIHRAPLEAIASVSSLITILRRVFSDTVDPFTIGRDALQYWSETLNAFLEERERLPGGRIFDLDYHEIRRDPITAIRRVYDSFGWSLSRVAEKQMRAVLINQPREQRGRHRYSLSQFGLEAVHAEAFSTYCERFDFFSRPARRPAERAEALVCKQDFADLPGSP